MSREPEIRVGLITDGLPQLEEAPGGLTRVGNMLIGEGFHWQTTVPAIVEGKIEPLDPPQGNIHAVNVLGLERYLESVIASEMNAGAPLEFLKAHAVISRSWAMRKITCPTPVETAPEGLISWEESDSHIGFDVCSDDHCQRYRGRSEEGNERAAQAVAETRGEVLADARGEIADARFYKCCGGRTELFSTCWADKDYDYLQPVDDPWSDFSDLEPKERTEFLSTVLPHSDVATTGFHDWKATASRDEIARRLEDAYGVRMGRILHLSKKSIGASGRVSALEITGTEGSATIGKELKIRRLLAADCLYSSWFDIKETADGFVFEGHGWGHGVGLCQIGAARMAWEGHDYADILSFYYHGTKLKKLYD